MYTKQSWCLFRYVIKTILPFSLWDFIFGVTNDVIGIHWFAIFYEISADFAFKKTDDKVCKPSTSIPCLKKLQFWSRVASLHNFYSKHYENIKITTYTSWCNWFKTRTTLHVAFDLRLSCIHNFNILTFALNYFLLVKS